MPLIESTITRERPDFMNSLPSTKQSDLISKKTRNELREFLVSWTLREIGDEFEAAGIAPDQNYQPPMSGQRRCYVEQFFHGLNFAVSDDVQRFLRAFENILKKAYQRVEDLSRSSVASTFPVDDERRRISHLVSWLEKDGYTFFKDRIVPTPTATPGPRNVISEVTRRNIWDFILESGISWWGRLTPTEFLGRIYDLGSLPSLDGRFRTADSDIRQHTEANDDWDPGWVFSDSRFNLLNCSDEEFVRFLAETLHPVVLTSDEDRRILLDEFNRELNADGWQLISDNSMSGKPLFRGCAIASNSSPALEHASAFAVTVNAGYLTRQITRMNDALRSDPELAIGTAKEFVETICKTILTDSGEAISRTDDLPRLVKLTTKRLKLSPDDVPDAAKGAEKIRVLLSNLSTVAQGIAELRGLYGTGHGKHAKSGGLGTRHAKLAVGAATTLGLFLFETFNERNQSDRQV